MSQSNGPNDDMRDATIVRPRGAAPAPAAPPPSQTQSQPAPAPAPASYGSGVEIASFLEGGPNPLVQAASPLLLLAVQLRHSMAPPDAMHLRDQTIAQIRRFENLAQAANIPQQTILAARYVLCTMLDEAVLNSPWGEHSGWAQKTLLVTFHSESYGGAKFFQILERLCSDFSKHIDLIELMYICLALGFAGRYQIEAGGRAKLADIQEDLYRRIQAQRAKPADELAPHWRGIEDRRNPLIRYVPLWVVGAFAAVILLGAFLFFYARLNSASSPISAQLAQIGLENGTPPDTARQPHPARKSLKQLLAPEEQAGQLTVDEKPDGQALVRLAATGMFPSGGVDVSADEVPLLHKITAALNQVQGRVIVVGHTDDQPVRSLKYKDNFELSGARARSVAQILSDGLDNPARIESNGAGSSQPIALPPDTPDNRTRNRRVEIMFIPED
jgi:type VI secretion system protein ImpK